MPQGEDESLQLERNRSAGGGVNNRLFPFDIAEDQSVELMNIDASTPGQRVKRQGTAITASGMTQGPILALAPFQPGDLDPLLLAVAPGTTSADNLKLWEWNGMTSQWTLARTLTGYQNLGAEVEIITGYEANVTTGNYVAMLSYDRALGNGATDGRYFYNGSTLWTTGIYTGGTKVLSYLFNRGFARGTGIEKNRLLFSDLINWTFSGIVYSGAQEVRFGGQSTQQIIAVAQFRQNEVIVFMADRIEELIVEDPFTAPAPLTNWRRMVIDTELGIIGPRAYAVAGQDVYFVDQYGNVRSIARTIQDSVQGSKSRPISESIHGFIRRINPSAAHKTFLRSFDRWLFLALPLDTASEPSHVFVLDVARSVDQQQPVWDGPWTNLNPAAMAVHTFEAATIAADTQPTLYIGQNMTADGRVVKWPRGQDDAGSPIVYQETTRRIHLNQLELDKKFERLEVYAVGTVNATMMVEASPEARGFKLLGYMGILGDSPLLPLTLPFTFGGFGVVNTKFDITELQFGRIRDIQFRFTVTTTGEVKFLGWSLFGWVENFEWRTTS